LLDTQRKNCDFGLYKVILSITLYLYMWLCVADPVLFSILIRGFAATHKVITIINARSGANSEIFLGQSTLRYSPIIHRQLSAQIIVRLSSLISSIINFFVVVAVLVKLIFTSQYFANVVMENLYLLFDTR